MKFSELQNFPVIFSEFVAGSAVLRRSLPPLPTLEDLRCRARQLPVPSAQRREVARLLAKQGGKFHVGKPSAESIEQLEASSAAVILFDLPAHLFGGPLSLLLKCITARKLAAALAQVGTPTVAVAFMAPCNHQHADCGSARILAEDACLREIKLAEPGQSHGSIGCNSPLSDGILTQLAHLENYLGRFADPEVMLLLRQTYKPQSTLSLACGGFFSGLLEDWGIIVVDPMDPGIQELVRPLHLKIVERAERVAGLINERLRELSQSGYLTGSFRDLPAPEALALQLKILGESMLDGEAPVPGSEWLLRIMIPIWLCSVMPVLTVLTDPWQLDEFALISRLFCEFEQAVPAVFPRLSATLVDSRSRHFLDKYELSLRDLLERPAELLARFSARDPALGVDAELGELVQASDHGLFAIAQESIGDSTLSCAIEESQQRVHFQLTKLREKLAAAGEERLQIGRRQIGRICNTLAPEGGLQERQTALISFLCRHSCNLPRVLEAKLDLWLLEHQLIAMD